MGQRAHGPRWQEGPAEVCFLRPWPCSAHTPGPQTLPVINWQRFQPFPPPHPQWTSRSRRLEGPQGWGRTGGGRSPHIHHL